MKRGKNNMPLYKFSLDYDTEANSKEEASKEIKRLIIEDAENLKEDNIDDWLGDVLTFSHVTED